MGYTTQEFETAYDKTAVDHPCIRKPLAEEVSFQFESNKLENRRNKHGARLPFGLLIRKTMNDMNLKGAEREAYKALIGHLFGPHGNWVAQMRKKQPAASLPAAQFSNRAPPPKIVIKANGQLAWEI